MYPTRRQTAALLGMALPGPALAAPRCKAAQAYEGPAPHPPPAAPDLDAAGPIDAPLPAAWATRLEAAFERALQATRAQALSVAVALPGRGAWRRQRGWDQPFFYWASAGKAATAAVVLQLAEEGRLSLGDPVAQWVPRVPNGEIITVEHLLAHTSGLYSANEDPKMRAGGRRLRLDEEIDVLRRRGPLFCPGQAWRYSNSGYALLGRIIEVAGGRSWPDALMARVVDRLALRETRVVGPDLPIHGIAPPRPDDAQPAIDLQTPGPAGPLAASAMDMVRLQQALLDGRLLRPETRAAQFARLYPMFDAHTYYGLGVMLYDVPDGARRIYWVGHGGGAPGVKALVAFSPRDRALVAVALTGDGSAPATANLLMKALAAA